MKEEDCSGEGRSADTGEKVLKSSRGNGLDVSVLVPQPQSKLEVLNTQFMQFKCSSWSLSSLRACVPDANSSLVQADFERSMVFAH